MAPYLDDVADVSVMVSWWWFSQGITLQQVSLINFTASLLGAGGIQAFKTMRTLRALRPLRAMSRMQGMRVSAVEIEPLKHKHG